MQTKNVTWLSTQLLLILSVTRLGYVCNVLAKYFLLNYLAQIFCNVLGYLSLLRINCCAYIFGMPFLGCFYSNIWSHTGLSICQLFRKYIHQFDLYKRQYIFCLGNCSKFEAISSDQFNLKVKMVSEICHFPISKFSLLSSVKIHLQAQNLLIT